ncbi:MAG: hypothetical protein M1834_000309 [Cirrosporium novae-zelandiae]|nr:MAG: hypothetical protein M1834_000309 [Cirrosporium novae-zelandiae]
MGNNPSKSGSGGPSPAQSPSVPRSERHQNRDSKHFHSASKSLASQFIPSPSLGTARSPSQRSSHKSILHRHSPSAGAAENASHKVTVGQDKEPRKSNLHGSEARPPESIAIGASEPVNVPPSDRSAPEPLPQLEPSGPPSDIYYIPPSQLNRPPRLPLPIEEEVHTPGSPIITPADIDSALEYEDVEGLLPRKTSMLSSTTVDDEEEIGDEMQSYHLDGSRKTVPTLVEWNQGGEKVYVTGTFADWNKKFRLSKDPNKDGLSATLQLPPGTHHLKFIVDGEMRTSDDLPTAVDFTNILVNYIEVNPDDAKPPARKSTTQVVPPGVFPPQVLPEPSAKDHAVDSTKNEEIKEEDQTPKHFATGIPQVLFDAEEDEDTSTYQSAAALISDMPAAPTLPLFLTKPVLNGTTPMKDDNSVLNYPNHTVINHLATSSIKNGVLATSATTRYKRKYVTTIVYKPTDDSD